MQLIRRALAAFVFLLALRAQDNPKALEDRAAALEAQYQYDSAKKVLDGAVALRAQVNGDQSAEYGLCLLKVGALERKIGRPKEAAAHYADAVRLLPGRPETPPVFLYLGISASGSDSPAQEAENLERARSLDNSLTGPVLMWTALMHERQGQADLAEAAYKSALAAENSDNMDTFETLTLYGRFLARHGRNGEAGALQARSTAIVGAAPMPAMAPSGGVYRVVGSVSPPTVVSKVDPPYSEEARVAKYSATVLLQLVVGVDGARHNIKVVKPAGFGLDDCAVSTLAKWVFNPGQKSGQPVPVYATVEINFRLL